MAFTLNNLIFCACVRACVRLWRGEGAGHSGHFFTKKSFFFLWSVGLRSRVDRSGYGVGRVRGKGKIFVVAACVSLGQGRRAERL